MAYIFNIKKIIIWYTVKIAIYILKFWNLYDSSPSTNPNEKLISLNRYYDSLYIKASDPASNVIFFHTSIYLLALEFHRI